MHPFTDTLEQNQLPSEERIHYAKKVFFEEQTVLYALLLVGLIALLVWHTLNPQLTFVNSLLLHLLPSMVSDMLRQHLSGPLQLNNLGLWRIIDYLVAAVLGVLFLLACLESIHNSLNPHAQFLILRPDGFTLKTDEKKPKVIEYQALSDLFVDTSKKDELKVVVVHKKTNEEQEITLDGRFGKPQRLSRAILNDFQVYQQTQK
uniref:Uncharacterized protein n=1 Tax=Thermosporothrix sp. COM3 TaxID=2490863 RepID=A0A455SHA8_9CHLR|nr:hypothetical protein KTC_10700 [Thermosporothrix sp. COM3]